MIHTVSFAGDAAEFPLSPEPEEDEPHAVSAVTARTSDAAPGTSLDLTRMSPGTGANRASRLYHLASGQALVRKVA